MGNTSIEWTDKTWNPIRGCTRVSEGCRHCYAEGVARRFSGPGLAYEGLVRIDSAGKPHEWNGHIKFVEAHLLDPLKWKEPKRIFVNSMSDLFHENVRWEWINKIFAVMALCPQHTFQILTKRPEVMGQYISSIGNAIRDADKWFLQGAADEIVDNCATLEDHPWPLPNVQLGVSCEDQTSADKRIPWLLRTPAAVRFLSCEPLLGEISLKRIRMPETFFGYVDVDALTADRYRNAQLVGFGGPRIDWVIAGGESGRGARPMHPDWARGLRDECQAAGTPFFFKQWGEWLPIATPRMTARIGSTLLIHRDGATTPASWSDVMKTTGDPWAVQRAGKKAAGAMLDGREWREFPNPVEVTA